MTATDPLGLWKQVDCTSGSGQCWEAEKGDSIGSFAEILKVSFKKLNKFFQNPSVEVGQIYDVSGFGRGNIPTTRDTGPAVVRVFLVSEPEQLDRIAPKDTFWPEPLQTCEGPDGKPRCYVGIFYPYGFGGLGRITFSGAGQKVGHGARHLTQLGVSQEAVESAIIQDIKAIQASTTSTGSFWGKVNVQGYTIVYRAQTLPDGTINVGTYYSPTP